MSEKQKIINYLSTLSDNLTYEEILYETLAYFKIEQAISAIEKGELLTTKEMREVIQQC